MIGQRGYHIAAEAFGLYEEFRPAISEGVKGWGAQGVPRGARQGRGR